VGVEAFTLEYSDNDNVDREVTIIIESIVLHDRSTQYKLAKNIPSYIKSITGI
jgi:hypothetical protein